MQDASVKSVEQKSSSKKTKFVFLNAINAVDLHKMEGPRMFGLFNRRNPHAAIEARARRAHTVWDTSDVEVRTMLVRSVLTINDDRLFLAYVNASWAQLPDSVRAKITGAVMVYDDTPGLLRDLADRIR